MKFILSLAVDCFMDWVTGLFVPRRAEGQEWVDFLDDDPGTPLD